jgi:hypothetical protein
MSYTKDVATGEVTVLPDADSGWFSPSHPQIIVMTLSAALSLVVTSPLIPVARTSATTFATTAESWDAT